MRDLVISQAQRLGFTCELTADNQNWQVVCRLPTENWELYPFEDRWLLSVKKVPQMYLSASEAIGFLERRHRFLHPQAPLS
jgi:hypothetical protein